MFFFLISSIPCFFHFLPLTFLYNFSSMYYLLHSFYTFCRSEYGNCSKISSSFSRPTSNHTTRFNGQNINSLQPLFPNQESPFERWWLPMVAMEQSDFSHEQETCLKNVVMVKTKCQFCLLSRSKMTWWWWKKHPPPIVCFLQSKQLLCKKQLSKHYTSIVSF